MKRALVWFKTDLRLSDNETLIKAIQWADEVIPVFIIDERQLNHTAFGFPRMGPFRYKFLLESLSSLHLNLKSRNSGLLIVKGRPEVEIPKIALNYQVQKVYTKKEIAPEEIETVADIEKELWKNKILLEQFSTSVLYHATDLPFSIKDCPDVFTVFRKKVEKEAQILEEFSVPEKISSPPISDGRQFIEFELQNLDLKLDSRAVFQYSGGEDEAFSRLNFYLFESNGINNYKETRNGLMGPDYSSKFSPFLALGCISPRTIYHAIKRYEKECIVNDSTYWLCFELLWRDFFRYAMKKHKNKLFHLNGFSKSTVYEHSIKNTNLFSLWISGNTGNSFIDANMKELKLTGFMSNRGRQNAASYLIHELHLDWRLGAAYFESQLIDYDVSSNWGNWAYIAGVGNDPKNGRKFNIEQQVNCYDKQGDYQRLWLNSNDLNS
jgi:deoxyribodipyrimidine photo-lyase